MFNEGFNQYIVGDWKRARKLLRQIDTIKKGGDEPTNVILNFMAEHNFEAPHDWEGWRPAE